MSAGEAPKSGRFPLVLDRLTSSSVPAAPAAAAREPLRPQRLLHEAAHEAAREASRQSAPSGIGMDSAWVRKRMVDRLRAEGLGCEAVLQAMAQVERHVFVDSALATQAYEDTSLPIGHGQTISKPSVVAHMLSLLFDGELARRSGHLGRTLEIGTGCGYQAALLAVLATELVSIERLRPLHERASRWLLPQVANGLQLIHADGMLGYAQRAPYQSIIAAAGGDALPEIWLEQLALGGRLVAPMTHGHFKHQVLTVVDKRLDGSVRQRAHDGVLFVPLRSGTL